jgi:hypothetical protein
LAFQCPFLDDDFPSVPFCLLIQIISEPFLH